MSSMECVDLSTFIGREITTVLNIAVDNVILTLKGLGHAILGNFV